MAKDIITRQEDARRQGAFEGRIEAKVDGLILSVADLVKTNTSLDGRLRNIEDGKSGIEEKFKDSDKIHTDLYEQIGKLTDSIAAIIKYQSIQRGVMIVLGVLSTIITPIITALIIRALK